MGSMEERKKRVGRAVTQRYDMASLRVVQGLEGKFNEDVAALYGCDEDELPFDIDTLGIFQSPPGSRRAQLVSEWMCRRFIWCLRCSRFRSRICCLIFTRGRIFPIEKVLPNTVIMIIHGSQPYQFVWSLFTNASYLHVSIICRRLSSRLLPPTRPRLLRHY